MLRHSSASGTWGGLSSTPFLNGVNVHIKQNWHIILPCILALFSTIDLVFTLIILEADRAIEQNPIMRYLLKTHGWGVMSAVKLGLTAVGCVLIWRALQEKKKFLIHLLTWITLGVYTLLGFWWIYCWVVFFFY